jgi:hypothetical protein
MYFTNLAIINRLNGSAPVASTANAIVLYDSGWEVTNAYFENYDTPHTYALFRPTGASNFNTHTRSSGVVLVNSPSLYGDANNQTFNQFFGQFGHCVRDIDGTLTGYPGQVLTTDHPLMLTPTCVRQRPGYFGFVCPNKYTEVRVQFDGVNLPAASIKRYNWRNPSSDNPMPATYIPNPAYAFYRWTAISNSDYVTVFVMPISNNKLTEIRMPNYNDLGDTVAVEIRNVRSVSAVVTNAQLASSCEAVYAGTTQQYYFNITLWKVCVRLVATEPSVWFYGNKYIGATLPAWSDLSEQPGNPTFAVTVPVSETCLTARLLYWSANSDIPATVDPVYHYQSSGYKHSWVSWPTGQCSPSTNPVYLENTTICGCNAAKNRYYADFANVQGYYDAYEHYIKYRYYTGNAYHCELCITPSTPPPSLPTNAIVSATKNCLQARMDLVWRLYTTNQIKTDIYVWASVYCSPLSPFFFLTIYFCLWWHYFPYFFFFLSFFSFFKKEQR